MYDHFPWESHTVDATGRYHRAPDGTWLLSFPKRKRFTEPFDLLRRSEAFDCRFDGFSNWWSVKPATALETRVLAGFVGTLGFELMPREWLNNLHEICTRGDGRCRFWSTEDGYRLRMPRNPDIIAALKHLESEMGSEGSFHLEWERGGCEILMRRNTFHARIRAFLAYHQFRLESRALAPHVLAGHWIGTEEADASEFSLS